MLPPWPPTHQLPSAPLSLLVHPSTCHHPVILGLLAHECVVRSNVRNAVLLRFATKVCICLSSPSYARPAPSLIRTVVHFVSGSLGCGRHSWCHQWGHATSSCCSLGCRSCILSALTERHSCPFDGTYNEARPDPFPDGFGCCTSTSISNFPLGRTKLITSPVLRCSAQLPSAVK